MAIPHYVYLLLKMPGPNGVLSLRGDLRRSYTCDKEAIDFAVQTASNVAQKEVLALVGKLTDEDSEVPTKKPAIAKIKPPGEVATKTVDLHTGDSSKTAIIGAQLSPK